MAVSKRPPSESAPQETLLVSVRVQPRASRDEVAREGEGLHVRISAPPVDGAANEALVTLLARRLGVPKRAVEVVRGASSRQKLVAVHGLSADDFWKLLDLAAER